MIRTPFLCVIVLLVAAVIAVVVHFSRLENARRPARVVRALSVGYELIYTTNSTVLDGTTKKFRADLASILDCPTWREIDRSEPGDRRGCVRLILTNEHGNALHMGLRDEYPSGGFRFRLLSYRKITEPSGAANGSQPIRSETNQTSSAAGSRR